MANNFPTIIPSLNLQFANTGVLPPDVTFTRASSSGGYYDGVTVSKAEENLLLQSQTFNTTWSQTGAVVTADTQTAPNGTTTADTLTFSVALSTHGVSQVSSSVIGTQRTASVFVKQGTHTFVQLAFSNDNQAFANFDVTTGAGAVGTVGTTASASIVDAGNGWFRCIITTSSATAGTTLAIYGVSSSTAVRSESWLALGTETLFLWGAQVEQRSSVTAYTPTTTQAITNYIPKMLFAPANVPVFDHDPVTGAALGLSVWEARTNLLQRSQEFDNAYWTKVGSSISANQIIAPDGTLTADKLIEDTATSGHSVQGTSVSVTSGVVYTFSIIAKAAERSFIRITGNSSGLVGATYYNLSTGALGTVAAGTTASIVALGNGVYRCIFTRTSTGTANVSFLVSVTNADNTSSYTGDGYSGIYIWGAQLEAGAFATPYIPTVASTVARSADAAVMTGVNFSRWFNPAQGTLVTESRSYGNLTLGPVTFEIGDGTVNNKIVTGQFVAGVVRSMNVQAGNVPQVVLANTADPTLPAKSAGSYKFNDFAGSVNGGTVLTDTVGLVPVVDRAQIGANTSGASDSQRLNGYLKSLSYYPIALTSAQLQAVTA